MGGPEAVIVIVYGRTRSLIDLTHSSPIWDNRIPVRIAWCVQAEALHDSANSYGFFLALAAQLARKNVSEGGQISFYTIHTSLKTTGESMPTIA